MLSNLFGMSPIEDRADQDDYEKKLVTHVKQKVEEARSSANRIAHEGIWMTNIAYLLGYDGIAFNTQTRSFQPVNRVPLKRNRLHANIILPTIQNRLAKLCKNPPKYDVRPESMDSEDKEAARLGVQILGAMWDKLKLNEQRLFLYMWVQQCGHSWLKVCWDDQEGKFMVNPETGERGFEGEVRIDGASPFEVFPNPYAKTQDEVLRTWLIHCQVRPIDYFKTHYPERGALVKPEECWLMSLQYQNRINSINNRGPTQGNMVMPIKDSAIEMIKYEARSKDYPNGRMIACANGVLLTPIDKELPVGEIPFSKFDDVIIGGKLFSESIITHLRPLQDHKNEVLRRRAEWTKKYLAGKYSAARGMHLSQESLNDGESEVVYWDPVPTSGQQGPTAIQPPVIPSYAYTEEDKIDANVNKISGISEVSQGSIPSASIPAIGMQLLVEQDDTRVGVITEQHEHAWARVGSLILKYVEKYYLLPRKIKIAGRNLEYTVKEIKGEDLRGNTDVYVIRGSTLPGSKTLRRQEILNAYSQGLLGQQGDPKVTQKVLDLTEFGDVSGLWEDYGLSMAQITRGIHDMEQGQPPAQAPSELDNHVLWVQELNRYRIQEKFNQLPPEVQGLFDSILEAHVQFMMPPQPPPPPTPGDMPPPQEGEPMPEEGAMQ